MTRALCVTLVVLAARCGRAPATGQPPGNDPSVIGRPPRYDPVVLADHPVAFWDLDARRDSEPDRSGHGHVARYIGGRPSLTRLPNGDRAAAFDGATQYAAVRSSAARSRRPAS